MWGLNTKSAESVSGKKKNEQRRQRWRPIMKSVDETWTGQSKVCKKV